MVDRISAYFPDGNNIDELQTGQLQQNQQIERVNRESAGAAQKSEIKELFDDSANISDEAKALLDAEKDLLRFSKIAARMDDPFDSDKVSYFKSLLDSGRINDYLSGLNNEDLAESLLRNPIGLRLI